jgi:protein-disulfide isomerase
MASFGLCEPNYRCRGLRLSGPWSNKFLYLIAIDHLPVFWQNTTHYRKGNGMKFRTLFTASILMAVIASSPMAIPIAPEPNVTEEQKKQIEKVVHDYLINHPEILLEVSQILQQKQQQTIQQQAKLAILGNANQLLNENMSIAGNPKGDVTLIEFFDYQCIHCKKMAPIISDLLKKNKNVRVIYKEFPIFGKSSELASRAALAAALQGKYLAMHNALFNQENRLTDQSIMDAAKSVGLNVAKLKVDMDSKPITDELDANRQLAEKLHLMGTPAFIIMATPAGKLKEGSTPVFIPGAASEESLQELLKKASETS